MSTTPDDSTSLSFKNLITGYAALQASMVSQMRRLASTMTSSANPGTFILLQFQMSQITQIGESISNLIAQVNSVINHAIQNQRVQ